MRSMFKLSIAAVLAASPSLAVAQATRTWVSGVGDDVNPCSRTAPCKTFAGAISKTAANGEINAIDSGGFGAVTITKSITIDGQGVHASILSPGVNGVVVNGPAITVTLRNLAINGAGGTTGNGIRVVNAAAVNVDNVRIQGFAGVPRTAGAGIAIETSAANVRITVTNSDIYNNFGMGIYSAPTAGNVILTVDNVRVSKGDFSSIQLLQNTTAFINRATLTNSRTAAGLTTEGAGITAVVSNSLLAGNQFGIFNGNGGAPVVRLYGNVITGNIQQGIQINAGSVFSNGNNAINGNAGNELPTAPVTPTK
jgi:hypothetical protein